MPAHMIKAPVRGAIMKIAINTNNLHKNVVPV